MLILGILLGLLIGVMGTCIFMCCIFVTYPDLLDATYQYIKRLSNL